MATPKKSATTTQTTPNQTGTAADQAKSSADLLTKVKKDYTAWYDYTLRYRRRWDNYWRLYNNQRIKRKYRGTSDTFDPMTHQMVETGVDNVYGSRPEMTFVPTKRDQEKDTKLLSGMWDYTWDKNNMDLRIMPFGRESKVVGNAALWCSPADGYMEICHVPFRDCIFDPAGVDEDSITYGGYRRLVMLEDAKNEKIYDPTVGPVGPDTKKPKGAWVARYENLENIQTYNGKNNGDLSDKELKDIYAGSTLSDAGKAGQIEIIMLYYRDKVVEMANRSVICYEGENKWHKAAHTVEIPLYDETALPPETEGTTPQALAAFVKESGLETGSLKVDIAEIPGFIPVALNRRYVDATLLLAKGDVEVFADSQEDLNDMRNAKKDNIAFNIKNVSIVDVTDPANNGVKSQLANSNPGDIVEAKGGKNVVGWMEKPNMTEAADAEIAYLKQSIRDTARIDQVAQGVSSPGSKTATEIDAQMAQASGGFNTEGRNLESGTYKRLGEIFDKYLKIFVTGKQVVRVLGREGVEWRDYDPDQFWGLYEAKPVLESRAKADKQAQNDNELKILELVAGNPALIGKVNLTEFLKKVMKNTLDMDEDDLSRLIMNPSPMNTATAGGLPVGDIGAGTGSAPGGPYDA